MGQLREECGVFGIFANKTENVASTVYYALYALQHRGQESCGIVVNDDGLFNCYKDSGLVNDVFTKDRLEDLGEGNMAVGHVRYGSEKSRGRENAQPIVVNHIKGRFAIAHNGSIINFNELKRELEEEGSIFHTTTATEVISYIITKERIKSSSIEEAVTKSVDRIKGAYAFVLMSPSKMIAVRDKYGLKPLCYGQRDDGSYVVASESCALDVAGAKLIRDLYPGEILVFTKDGVKSIKEHCDKVKEAACVFEYVYFARPDSVLEGCSVHKARVRAGQYLAKEHPVEADVVIGVPDSGLDAAIGYSMESKIPYGIGLIKNKYIGRTFIAPGQSTREDKVRIKLNPVEETVKGKRVVIIDDSIVRGTTSERLVKILRDAGAKEVHMRISSPPFVEVCHYGTDIDSKDSLIACKHTVEEIAKIIGADTLGYLSVDSVKKLAEGGCNKGFCTACFDGIHPAGVPKDMGKNKFDTKISDKENK